MILNKAQKILSLTINNIHLIFYLPLTAALYRLLQINFQKSLLMLIEFGDKIK